MDDKTMLSTVHHFGAIKCVFHLLTLVVSTLILTHLTTRTSALLYNKKQKEKKNQRNHRVPTFPTESPRRHLVLAR